MGLRLGVTTREEFHMRMAIKAGKSWESVARDIQDADLAYVKENIYKPLLEQHESGSDITAIIPQAGDLSKPSGAQDGPPPGEPPPGTKPL